MVLIQWFTFFVYISSCPQFAVNVYMQTVGLPMVMFPEGPLPAVANVHDQQLWALLRVLQIAVRKVQSRPLLVLLRGMAMKLLVRYSKCRGFVRSQV